MEHLTTLKTIKNKQTKRTSSADTARIKLSEQFSKSKTLHLNLKGAWINSCGNQFLCNGYFAIKYNYAINECVSVPHGNTPPQIVEKILYNASNNTGTCITKLKKELLNDCKKTIKKARTEGKQPLMYIQTITDINTNIKVYFNPQLMRTIINTLTNDINSITVCVSNQKNAATSPIYIKGGNGCACLCTVRLTKTSNTVNPNTIAEELR